MLYPVIFILVLIAVIIFLFIKVSVLIEYTKKNSDDNITLTFYILGGLIKYKYEVPLVDLKTNGFRSILLFKKGKRGKEVKKEKKTFSFIELFDRIKYFKYSDNPYARISRYIWKKLDMKELRLFVEIGTEDAAYTGILSGMTWALVGIIDSYLSNNFGEYKKKVMIKPNFSEKEFKVDLYCIFKFKLVHIIIVGIKILLNYYNEKFKKVKRAIGGDVSG